MKKRVAALLCAALTALSLSGCRRVQEMERQIFAMDTIMTLTVYHDAPSGAVEGIVQDQVDRIYELESLLSVTREGSDVHNLNRAGGETVVVSRETGELLRRALELCEQTGGALDITAYPAVKAWGFTTGENRVPDETELTELAELIDYRQVTLEGEHVALPEGIREEDLGRLAAYEDKLIYGEKVSLPAGMEIDLGAVAKGYTGEVIADALRKANLSVCLSLGGNVQTVGANPEGKPWRVGIQDPESTAALAVVEVIDQAVVTSGNYQRYFEENGQMYGHIIDPDTAAPADSGLTSVTIVGDSGLRCDGLSTALFVMGLEQAHDFWRQHRDFEAVFVTEDGNIHITAGLEDRFSLAKGQEHREVSILA